MKIDWTSHSQRSLALDLVNKNAKIHFIEQVSLTAIKMFENKKKVRSFYHQKWCTQSNHLHTHTFHFKKLRAWTIQTNQLQTSHFYSQLLVPRLISLVVVAYLLLQVNKSLERYQERKQRNTHKYNVKTTVVKYFEVYGSSINQAHWEKSQNELERKLVIDEFVVLHENSPDTTHHQLVPDMHHEEWGEMIRNENVRFFFWVYEEILIVHCRRLYLFSAHIFQGKKTKKMYIPNTCKKHVSQVWLLPIYIDEVIILTCVAYQKSLGYIKLARQV